MDGHEGGEQQPEIRVHVKPYLPLNAQKRLVACYGPKGAQCESSWQVEPNDNPRNGGDEQGEKSNRIDYRVQRCPFHAHSLYAVKDLSVIVLIARSRLLFKLACRRYFLSPYCAVTGINKRSTSCFSCQTEKRGRNTLGGRWRMSRTESAGST
jgi:hypothetical protein